MIDAVGSSRWGVARRWRGVRPLAAAAVLSTLVGGASVAGETSADPSAFLSERGLKGFVTVDRLPRPASAVLAGGRAVWGENCQNCHGGDKLTGAPKITSAKKWRKRIDQGLPVLFQRAREGFLGPTYKEMPARGGNPDLTDEQVEAAVAFMVWASGGAATVETWLQDEN